MESPRLTDAQQERLYELFEQASSLEAAERAAFCLQQCGEDDALRHELATLLAAAPDPDDKFLNESVLSMAPLLDEVTNGGAGATAQPHVPDPEQIGPYRILERLGEGGMGVVYRAEQQEPVRRQVALKVIKPGMDTERVVRRFEAERQALALMDHPGIARIHDAGATAEGRPWFAMEVVAGQPLSDYCREQRLSTRERLTLFAEVCDAVQHAHQKGVIHRDLKPSNVLVTDRDGAPRAVIIDFGIARAMSEPLTERTLLTRQHEMLGTLDYMAPEQASTPASGRADPRMPDVDSRADIYSLGVMLYELLTGERPFDNGALASTPLSEVRRTLHQRTPATPSTRIGRSATAEAAATSQRTDVRALCRTLRGELDWITIKALEPDRERRYASASELAAEVRRYLHDEPVLVGPPSSWYRLRTFARRHRAPVTAAAAIMLTILVGTAATLVALFDARDQRDRATQLSIDLQAAVELAQAERTGAESARVGAESVSDFMVDLLALTNPENGPNVDKRAMLDYAAAQVATRFVGQPRAEAKARKVIGEAYATLNENEKAIEHLERALALREGLPDVTPLELYEILWPAINPLVLTGSLFRGGAFHYRCLDTTCYLFATDHPELASLLWTARNATDSTTIAPLVQATLAYADSKLRNDDPRWLALADFLQHLVMSLQLLQEDLEVIEPINSSWFERVTEIYQQELELPATNSRLVMAELYRIEILRLNGRFDAAVRQAEVAATKIDAVLGKDATHWSQVVRRFSHGLSLVALRDFERGLPLVEAALAMATSSFQNIRDRAYVMRKVMLANADGGRVERAEELRRELVATLRRTPNSWIRFRAVEAVIGPGHSDFMALMRTCFRLCRETDQPVPELAELVLQCRKRFPSSDEIAAVVAGGLHYIALQRIGDPQLLPMLEYCVDATRAATASLAPRAHWFLACAQLQSGAVERALATADAGIGTCTGAEPDLWNGWLTVVRARCLMKLGRAGVEAELLRCYDEQLKFDRGAGAFQCLLDLYLSQGRAQDGLELARRRLEQLLLRAAPPERLHQAVWSIVRSPAGQGAPAELAVQAARKALMLEPENSTYRMGLGTALLRTGRADALAEAIAQLADAERLQAAAPPEPATSLPALQAIALARLGRSGEAHAALLRARSQLAASADIDVEVRLLIAEAEAAVSGR